MTGEGGRVGHNYAIPDQAIMGDVRLGHQETIVADFGNSTAAGSAAMDSDKFANASSPPDFRFQFVLPRISDPEAESNARNE